MKDFVLTMIRHAATQGNLARRYIGVTDEPLCPEGVETLRRKAEQGYYDRLSRYGAPSDRVFCSPTRRTVQSARLIFPEAQLTIDERLKECDFGAFENKNYRELSGSSDYQAWIDADGKLPFPHGESVQAFRRRSVSVCAQIVREVSHAQRGGAVIVAHNGTIMSFACHVCGGNYYDWGVPPACGIVLTRRSGVWSPAYREDCVCPD